MSINNDIRDRSISHMIWTERYKTSVVNKMISQINRAENSLRDQLAKRLVRIEERGYDLGKSTTARIEKMLDELLVARMELYKQNYSEAKDILQEFAEYEATFQAGMIEEVANDFDVSVNLTKPSASQLASIVTSRPFQGGLLKEWYSRLEQNEAQRLRETVRIGIAEGQTTDQIVRRVVGSKAMLYKDGILEITRREASAVIRTAIAHVAIQSKDELYKANADIVKGVKWTSTLDSRTSSICRARDGEIFPIDTGPRPPAHINCRSTVIPYLGDTEIKGTRASQFGPVPEDTTYSQWLKKQPLTLQEEVLGKRKAQLFRKGDLSLDRFVDENGRGYTLDELKKRDRTAWDKTFPQD